MVDTKEILERLEEKQRQEKIKKIKEWLQMSFKDLERLIKLAQNSGINLKNITISGMLKVLRDVKR